MYRTSYLKAKVQILQTATSELPKDTTKKMKMSIKFDQKQKYQKWMKMQQQRVADQQQAMCNLDTSSSDQQIQIQPQQPNDKVISFPSIRGNKLKKPSSQPILNSIQSQIQKTIVYNQNFYQKLSLLTSAFNVTLFIHPNKLTFKGYDVQQIEDAMEQVSHLLNTIDVEYISKYGTEMLQSPKLKLQLEKVGVKVFRLVNRFYRWHQLETNLNPSQQKQKQAKIIQTIKSISNSYHCLLYLSTIQLDIDWRKAQQRNQFIRYQSRQRQLPYRSLLQSLKCHIFQQQLSYRLNKNNDSNEIQFQLNLSNNGIVIHSIAQELLEINIKAVKTQYQCFDYFFVTLQSTDPIEQGIQVLEQYKYYINKEQENNRYKEFNNYKMDNYIHYQTNYYTLKQQQAKHKQQDVFQDQEVPFIVIFCIGFRRTKVQKLQFLKQMLQKLHLVWFSSTYKFSIQLQKKQQIQSIILTPQFSYQQKLLHLCSNQITLQNNLFILNQYIILNKLKCKPQSNINQKLSNSTLNISNSIQDSTYLQERTLIQNQKLLDEGDGFSLKNQMEKNYHGDNYQLLNDVVQKYHVFFQETSKQYNAKYQDNQMPPPNLIIKTDKRNKPLQEKIVQTLKNLGLRVYAYKLKLNVTHKIPHFYSSSNDLITCFLPKSICPFPQQPLKFQSFPIKLFIQTEVFRQNGYLININRKDVYVEENGFKVMYGKEFQIAKEIVFLKDNNRN